jgi:hypothetical protein
VAEGRARVAASILDADLANLGYAVKRPSAPVPTASISTSWMRTSSRT